MNIIFIAPPAAGKGTQSSLLESSLGYLHVSTGDLLRAEIAKKSEFGIELQNIISKGELVSDEIITKLLKDELIKIKDNNFILDGYPRNIAQAEILNNLFSELKIDNYVVIYLSLDEKTAMERALGRMVCSKCGMSYNKYFEKLKPKKNDICDKCGSSLEVRSDDNEETFKNRFNTFLSSTNPLLEYYKEKGRLHEVDSAKGSEATFEAIKGILGCDVDNK